MFFLIVKRSDNKNSGVDTPPPPPGPGGRRCKLSSRGIYGSHERDACLNFRDGSFNWKLKVVVHFLRVKRDPRATSHPNPLVPDPSNANFEIAIF